MNYKEITEKIRKFIKPQYKSCSHAFDEDNPSPHHEEGSVWNHNEMVYDYYKNNFERNFIDEFAVLLHDIGKLWTRVADEEKKRVTFRNHAQLGTFLAYNTLKTIGEIDPKTYHQEMIDILSVINLHMESAIKGNEITKRKLFTPSEINIFNSSMLLNVCDNEGRISKNKEKRDVREESDFFTEVEPAPENAPEISILIGLPASGKSTYRKETELPFVCRDDIVMEHAENSNYNGAWESVDQKEVDKIFREELLSLIKNKKSFIVDKTSLTRKGRRAMLNLSKGFRKKAIVFMASTAEIVWRNELRRKDGKEIPVEVILRMMKTFNVPMYAEGFHEIEWVFQK